MRGSTDCRSSFCSSCFLTTKLYSTSTELRDRLQWVVGSQQLRRCRLFVQEGEIAAQRAPAELALVQSTSVAEQRESALAR